MIHLFDAVVLMRAKLHSKRILLLSTIVVSGVLFATLYAVVIVFSGVKMSVNYYTQAALGNKYLVKSSPVIPSSVYGPSRIDPSDEVIQTLNKLQADYIAERKSVAKEEGIDFDEKSIAPIFVPNPYSDKTISGTSRPMINVDSPVYSLYLEKLQKDYIKIAKNNISSLKKSASPYGATEYHILTPATTSYQTMSYLYDGKEDITTLDRIEPSNQDLSTYGYLTASVRNSTYSFIDDSLVQRFILPTNDRRKENSSAIPVVITTKEAVDLFGKSLSIGTKPDNASDQIAWMKNLQQKINGITYTTCYRNQADRRLIIEAAQVLSDIEKNKDNNEYVRPALVYNLPTEPCGGLTVKEDRRTADEKRTAEEEIRNRVSPVHQQIAFQIVGVMPVLPQSSTATDLSSLLPQILSAQYGVGAIIPKQMYEALPQSARHEKILVTPDSSTYGTSALQKAGIVEVVVEFTSLDSARSFINEQGCASVDGCRKPFVLEVYGVNYLLADDLNATVTKALQTALLVVIVIASVIIWFTMSRVIYDSRRETAVFRAIGAKRSDIIAVYLLYSIVIALRIVVFAILLGVGVALVVQLLFADDASNYAKATYGVFNNIKEFSLFDFSSPLLVWLTLVIISISILAVLPPLIRNVQRNPIRDMRDE